MAGENAVENSSDWWLCANIWRQRQIQRFRSSNVWANRAENLVWGWVGAVLEVGREAPLHPTFLAHVAYHTNGHIGCFCPLRVNKGPLGCGQVLKAPFMYWISRTDFISFLLLCDASYEIFMDIFDYLFIADQVWG